MPGAQTGTLKANTVDSALRRLLYRSTTRILHSTREYVCDFRVQVPSKCQHEHKFLDYESVRTRTGRDPIHITYAPGSQVGGRRKLESCARPRKLRQEEKSSGGVCAEF